MKPLPPNVGQIQCTIIRIKSGLNYTYHLYLDEGMMEKLPEEQKRYFSVFLQKDFNFNSYTYLMSAQR